MYHTEKCNSLFNVFRNLMVVKLILDPSTIQLNDTPDLEDLILFYTKASAMQPFECKKVSMLALY